MTCVRCHTKMVHADGPGLLCRQCLSDLRTNDTVEPPRCATCRAWTQELASESKLDSYAPGFGACRRRSPTVIGNLDDEWTTLDWPITHATDWCCDHLPR